MASKARIRQIPTSVGKSLKKTSLELLKSIRVIDPSDVGVADCEELLKSLSDLSLEAENPLRNLAALRAELFWLIGSILNRLAPIEKGKRGLIPQGKLGPTLKRLGFSRSWSENARWSSVLFNRQETQRLTVEAMKRAVAEHTRQIKGRKKKQGKNPKSAIEGWRVVGDFGRILSGVESGLQNIVENLPDAVDLLDDPETSLEVLSDATESRKRILGHLSDLDHQIAWAIEQARDEKVAVEKALAEQKKEGATSVA